MKRMRIAFLTAAAVTAAPAAAQSILPLPHVYAGVEAGRGSRDGIDVDDGDRSHEHSLDYGAFAGVEVPAGLLTYMAVEAGVGSATGSIDTTAHVDGQEVAARANPGLNWQATARLGLKPFPGLAAYGIGGYGGERVHLTALDGSGADDNGWAKGLIYGVGARYTLGSTMIRAEYRHRQTDGRYDPDQLLAGLAFRF